MGKFFALLFVILVITLGGSYYYYIQTGYKFGLGQSFIFKGTIGVTSPDFATGEELPSRFTCDGEDISPRFNLENLPEGTKSLAVILEDVSLESAPFTHWLAFNINPSVKKFDSFDLFGAAIVGVNDFGATDYNGPCPPVGKRHKYYFRVYALNNVTQTERLNRISFDKVTSGHIISSGSMIGFYTKKP